MSAASSSNATYYTRSSALSEALQALIAATVATATEINHAVQLNASAARFDTVATALEQDLLTLARSSQSRPKPMPHQLLRTLIELEEAAAHSGRR